MTGSLGDDINKAVRSATDGIHEDIHSAMDDVRVAMEDLGFDPSDEEGAEDTLDRRFDVGPDVELSVSTFSGRVSITVGEESVIRVRATKGGSSKRRLNTLIEIEQTGNRVTVETKSGKGSWGIGRGSGSVDFDIVVPRGCKTHVRGVSADSSIHGTQAPVEVETVSGDVDLEDVAGECNLTSVSGDIQGTRVAGILVARSTSGDITMSQARFQRFHLNSVSGDFVIDTPLSPNEHYFARTISGDLQLILPSSTGATVQLKTTSGDVHSDLPAEIIKAGRRHWQGRINGGGAHVEMASVSGDLHISRGSGTGSAERESDHSGSAATPAPVQSTGSPGAAEATTTSILRQLELGEITVEEAMSRLESLR